MGARVSVTAAIERSAQHFQDIVWPALSMELGGGQVIPVETVTDSEMTRTLDMLGGVDVWLVCNKQIWPLASRVQYGPTAWNTFTIRYSLPSGAPTEYHKRRQSIRSGSLYPKVTIHAYIHDGRLLAAAAVDTAHLLDVAEAHEDQIRVNPADGVKFLYVSWDQCDPRMTIRVGGC